VRPDFNRNTLSPLDGPDVHGPATAGWTPSPSPT
jgi:hypothetical protein